MRDYHYGVYIGRFQPLHIGHEHVIREALTKVETLVIVIGSAFTARTPVNPFSWEERREMLRMVFAHEIATGRILIAPLYDYADDGVWAEMLDQAVTAAIDAHEPMNGNGQVLKIALAGFGKDASSYYLKMFPCWDSIQIETQHGTINASDIRYDYFRRLPRYPTHAVSPRVLAYLDSYALTPLFRRILEEKEQYQRDRIDYGNGPFLTADALVTWRGKVLLVTRGKKIGYGLLAMPGGFVNADERIFDAALRELAEETTIKGGNLADYVIGHTIADNPKRSLRGRVVSTVYHFAVPDEVELLSPVGTDDAMHAGWYDFKALSTEQFFEDHYQLITELLS